MYFYNFNDKLLFIDSGKRKDKNLLKDNLNKLNLSISDILWFVATHGHEDHIGGASFFKEAEKFIHKNDLNLLTPEFKSSFTDIKNFSDQFARNSKYKIIYLGHHTEGSIAIYDQELRVLFIGDHICFFGFEVPKNDIIYQDSELREKQKEIIKELVEDPETYKENNLKLFFKGLRKIKKYDIKYLCTGHGVVLKNEINNFIKDLIDLDTYS